ncbi:hypothetical protein DFJ74DRAFT_682244 [Hyaloraphidium curvatum]|nr:hypothetical protein DFJ74DRAFT_682244 [Hyaloraphidium curvatum]
MLAAGWAERRAEFHMEDRKKPENASAYSAPWICFERLFFDATYGRYFSSAEAWAEWRREALALLGLDEPPPPPEDRCINPRVAVYVRDPGSSANGNRAMVNLAEVLSALGNLTRRPIATISFTPATPVPDQALAFSSFGLLVTPRGSQLGNVGYLPLRNGRADAAIVEVSSFLREHTSHASGEGIGAPYVLSTEHIPVPGHSRSRSYRCHPRPEAFRAERCGRTGPQVSWWCSHGDGRSLLGCSLGVDVGVLLRDAGRALGWLCGNGTVVGGG